MRQGLPLNAEWPFPSQNIHIPSASETLVPDFPRGSVWGRIQSDVFPKELSGETFDVWPHLWKPRTGWRFIQKIVRLSGYQKKFTWGWTDSAVKQQQTQGFFFNESLPAHPSQSMSSMNSIWQMNLPTPGSSIRDWLRCDPKNGEVLAKHPLFLITELCVVETKADIDT